MASTSIPRFLLPRGQTMLRSTRLQTYALGLARRNASTTAKPQKARLLEKPDAFRPPSHAARRVKPKAYPGPPLSEHERAAQKTRQYPHMMPPEGSFMHWFLTNKAIHTWITLGVLVTLAFFTVLTNFLHNTPYRDQLPPNSFFLSHPFRFIGRYMEVYKMHTDYLSAQTADRRKQKVEDVQKRSEYRKAHGLETGEGVLGGWTAKTDSQAIGPAIREGGVTNAGEAVQLENGEIGYVDFEGKGVQPRKKWLGIW